MSIKGLSYRFEVELLEDLFAYTKSTWKQQEGRLFSCSCVIQQELDNRLDFFEPVYGRSLNEVYKNAYVHFFGNTGNPAVNALDRFFLFKDGYMNPVRNFLPRWDLEGGLFD